MFNREIFQNNLDEFNVLPNRNMGKGHRQFTKDEFHKCP